MAVDAAGVSCVGHGIDRGADRAYAAVGIGVGKGVVAGEVAIGNRSRSVKLFPVGAVERKTHIYGTVTHRSFGITIVANDTSHLVHIVVRTVGAENTASGAGRKCSNKRVGRGFGRIAMTAGTA